MYNFKMFVLEFYQFYLFRSIISQSKKENIDSRMDNGVIYKLL